MEMSKVTLKDNYNRLIHVTGGPFPVKFLQSKKKSLQAVLPTSTYSIVSLTSL